MVTDRPPVWLGPCSSSLAVVAIGASAGGLRAIRTLLSGLSRGFPGSILVAHHRSSRANGPYLHLLQKLTPLCVLEAVNGARLTAGAVYLAPTGRHLELRSDGRIYTGRSERVNTVRPSVDLLFTSVAARYGDRAVGVVLSGMGRDGVAGVQAIRGRGGFVIAQDRATSDEFGMPCSAIETRRVDLVLPLHHIGFALNTLFSETRRPNALTVSRGDADDRA
ncbi:MAG TPA: chemotaxis protein CheB [Verrucomicrobiae bacterium]|jgi:two-component system, chemotaxis family, protein-glutamate methylesterase/glutaminase|nr:chemotaxis protein CheB [Verrucomicrobiae bacterium]